MQNYIKALSLLAWLWLIVSPLGVRANEYGAEIRYADLSKNSNEFEVTALVDYTLSPTSKEALLKGIPLEWLTTVEIRQKRWLWDSRLMRLQQPYKLQFHALLNQYAVQSGSEHTEMFLTLNAALDYMSQLQIVAPLDLPLFSPDSDYLLAIKTEFRREALPVPLRPFAYLDPQWYLSSIWFLWPIPK